MLKHDFTTEGVVFYWAENFNFALALLPANDTCGYGSSTITVDCFFKRIAGNNTDAGWYDTRLTIMVSKLDNITDDIDISQMSKFDICLLI